MGACTECTASALKSTPATTPLVAHPAAVAVAYFFISAAAETAKAGRFDFLLYQSVGSLLVHECIAYGTLFCNVFDRLKSISRALCASQGVDDTSTTKPSGVVAQHRSTLRLTLNTVT